MASSSRRAENESEASTASVTSVTNSLREMVARSLRVAGDLSGLTFLDETSLKKYGPEQVLSRMLSTKSYISTSSSQAARNQAAHDGELVLRAAREVGKGQCGTVYAMTGTQYVLKMPNDGKVNELFEDCCIHKEIEEAFSDLEISLRPEVNIPAFGEWIHPSNDQFWNSYLQYLPANTPKSYGLLSSRILPLPEPVREAIWTQFAPQKIRDGAAKQRELAEPKNKDCLVRVYLGRRIQRTESPNFKLRNFELSVNEMEYLRLDTKMYADTMGRTLAFLHWKVGVDANDVEFVLGSTPMIKPAARAAEYRARGKDGARFIGQGLDFTHRAVRLWLLDFNQCKRFPGTAAGLKQLVDGFYWNDPYYPRPGAKETKDQQLWITFKEAYLEMSGCVSTSKGKAEPFIKAVEVRSKSQVGTLF
ncbi:uncharacterized protein PG986_006486 [Apiospora aurea]|uniref:DUF3669 domain-containing protein n=1 Tax=Apiospora aurea TaxID=335848 RepID=A0ABR1QKI2_9PEZI